MNLKVACSKLFGFGAEQQPSLAAAAGASILRCSGGKRNFWCYVQWTRSYLTCDCGVLPPFPTRIWHLLGLVVPLLFLDLSQNP